MDLNLNAPLRSETEQDKAEQSRARERARERLRRRGTEIEIRWNKINVDFFFQ